MRKEENREDGFEKLIQYLKNDDFIIRALTARALGDLNDQRALEPLISCLNDRQSEVRAGASYALGRFGDYPLLNFK